MTKKRPLYITIRTVLQGVISTDDIREYFDSNETDDEIVKRLANDNGQYTCLLGDVAGMRPFVHYAIIGDMTP